VKPFPTIVFAMSVPVSWAAFSAKYAGGQIVVTSESIELIQMQAANCIYGPGPLAQVLCNALSQCDEMHQKRAGGIMSGSRLVQEQATVEEARRIIEKWQEEWREEFAQFNRKVTEEKERFAAAEAQRLDSNDEARQVLVDFLKAIDSIRPRREQYGFGPKLEAIIMQGLYDLVGFYHGQITNHYDARKDT
jgi:hypothetical protein